MHNNQNNSNNYKGDIKMSFYLVLFVLVLACAFIYVAGKEDRDYKSFEEDMIDNVSMLCEHDTNLLIYEPDDLTCEILESRKESDGIYVERVVGISDRDGNGKILNTADARYNYISYRYSGLDYNDGTVILTYNVFNPKSQGSDDVIARYDYVLSRDWETQTIQKEFNLLTQTY